MDVQGLVNALVNDSLSNPPRLKITEECHKSSTMPLPQQVYECLQCSRPAFTGFRGKVGAEENLWVFELCFRVVISPKRSSIEGHPLFWVNCRCGQELGYFVPRNAVERDPIWFNNYITIVERIQARANAGKNEGRILHWFQLLKQRPIVDGYHWLLEDLFFEEILPRLPVESLMRFRGVCKKLRHCISDSRFISNHLRRSSENTKMSIILATHYSHHRMLFVDHCSNTTEVVDVSMLTRKCGDSFFHMTAVGCCDGLVCLMLRHLVSRDEQYDGIILWNPETGQSRYAQVLPPHCFGESYREYPVYGFGFDQSHNDYKVVKLRKAGSGIKLSVFSRNTGCWRELEKGVLGCKLDFKSDWCVLFGTRLYWEVILASVRSQRFCILWFDLNDDEFGIMDVGFRFRAHCLVKWNSDSLAILDFAEREFHLQFILHPAITPNISFPDIPPSRFLGVSRDRFFMNENSNLVMYDFETGVARSHQLFTCNNNCLKISDDVHDYVPSLVSVYPNLTTTRHDTQVATSIPSESKALCSSSRGERQ